jgi:transcriptional regulator NrdR family protein
VIFLEIGEHAFNCPFCGNKYSEFVGQSYSEEVSKKAITRTKCNICKERFAITINYKGDLVTYKDRVIKDRKKYQRNYKRLMRKN